MIATCPDGPTAKRRSAVPWMRPSYLGCGSKTLRERIGIAGGTSTALMPIAPYSREGTTWIPRLRTRATRPTESAASSGGTSTRSSAAPLGAQGTGEGTTWAMATYEFTLRLDQEVDEAQADALYAAFHDGSIMTGAGGTEIEFSREAASWVDAILSAVRDVEGVPGLRVTGAGQEHLVSLLDIAHRAHRSREAVRLWAVGKRGPGGFPAPAWRSPSGSGSGLGRMLPGG